LPIGKIRKNSSSKPMVEKELINGVIRTIARSECLRAEKCYPRLSGRVPKIHTTKDFSHSTRNQERSLPKD